MKTFRDFIAWEKASQDTVDVKLIYIDMVEDLVAGILLSQIVYWYLPNKNGESKLRVKKEGQYWIAKKREDWWDEIRISPKQFDRASEILVCKGIIEKKKFKFAGDPVVHIRLLFPTFLGLLESVTNSNVQKLTGECYKNMTEQVEDTLFNQKGNFKLPEGEDENTLNNDMKITKEIRSYTKNNSENSTESNSFHQSANQEKESKNSYDDGWIDNNYMEIVNKIYKNCGLDETDNYYHIKDGEGREYLQPIKRAIKDMVRNGTTTMTVISGMSRKKVEFSRDDVVSQLFKLNVHVINMAIETMVEYNSAKPIKNPIEFAKTVLFNEADQWEHRMQQKIDVAIQEYRKGKVGGMYYMST